jgi:hypothetical protein
VSSPTDQHDTTATESSRLCVLGCADRQRTDIWPRPPRPRVDGLLTCRSCADRILDVLDEVLERTATLALVTAAGSAPRSGDGGRKRIKDEPVAPVPVRLASTALTDVRSSRGTWVPDGPTPEPAALLDADGRPVTVDQLRADVDTADRALRLQLAVFGPGSEQARAAATQLSEAHARLRHLALPRSATPPMPAASDNDPASVVGFLDKWTDRVRVGRELLAAGPCPATWRIPGPTRAIPGPAPVGQPWPMADPWPMWDSCGQPTEYRRLIRIDAGARTTGLFAVCPAGHVTRPDGQGDQVAERRAGHGHRPTGTRHGLTVMAAIGLLRRHNEWICTQDWVPDYWRALRALRRDLGQAHGELRPAPIGNCPNGTGQVDDHGHEIECGQPLYASGYSDTIECTRCGRTWDHKQWRHLGQTIGVIA